MEPLRNLGVPLRRDGLTARARLAGVVPRGNPSPVRRPASPPGDERVRPQVEPRPVSPTPRDRTVLVTPRVTTPAQNRALDFGLFLWLPGSPRQPRIGRASAVEGSSALERPAEGELVGILEVAADRQPARDTGDGDAERCQQPPEVHRGGLTL